MCCHVLHVLADWECTPNSVPLTPAFMHVREKCHLRKMLTSAECCDRPVVKLVMVVRACNKKMSMYHFAVPDSPVQLNLHDVLVVKK